MTLLINACARPDSRTLPLARRAAERLSSDIQVLNLYDEHIVPLDNQTLSKRDRCVMDHDYSDDIFCFAKQFKAADSIVIAAPYWDLSFPSILKCYIESICVNGLTFCYNENGIPVGLCNAKTLIYVTTAGGYISDGVYGFGYIKQLCEDYFGISSAVCIKAEGLDLLNADVAGILTEAENTIDLLIKSPSETI